MAKIPFITRLSVSVLSLVLALPATTLALESDLEPEALEILQNATDFLGAQKSFRVNTETTIEFVLDSNQKIQFDHFIALTVQRPNRLRAERLGELVDQGFYYDGEVLTIDAPDSDYYASVPAPDTIDEMLDYIRTELGFVAPASDLVYSDAFDRLTADLTSAFVVGLAEVDGIVCDHLAFRNDVVDWQIWIERGDTPLPRKMVVTSKLLSQSPQYSVVLSEWESNPEVCDCNFKFVPSPDAKRIDFLNIASDTTP